MSIVKNGVLVLTLLVAARAGAADLEQMCTTPDCDMPVKRELPSPMLAAYANWGQCDEKLVTAAEDGVNTLLWFSINLVKDQETGRATITGPATGTAFYDCVARITLQMKEKGLEVTHMISIGGWNSPHPDPAFSAREWWGVWKAWNENEVARPEQGWPGFAGFDWDIEGNDDGAHHGNVFTQAVLDLMGELSVLAKQGGYLVAMAPAQSYLDCTTDQFSRKVNFPPGEPWMPDFFYAGRNTYGYLLAKYGVETFDFISIQLYEGYSTANYAISQNGMAPADYLQAFVKCVTDGWAVDFGDVPGTGLGRETLKIEPNRLVIGLANGWTGPPPDKFLLMWPEDCGVAYTALQQERREPRGFMFWNVADEGIVVERTDPPRTLWLARGLATFLFPHPEPLAQG